ncbi:MAG: ABC transporter permease [Methanomicrobiales archaeon HGW-Methanomicrobiales-1]|jgi:putative ABC transport system permease protein|nr:MAG: ABC transporter permease [Methanomicrobiales archaeon HGW-Methanomicrobiales-1]
MIFWEIAKRNIRIHLLRSSLAMLGIVIGVVAIASMGILGNSMVLSVSDSLKTVGDSVIVTPHAGGSTRGFGGGGGGSTSLTLSEQDFQQIKRVSAPNVAIPVLQTSDRMKLGVGSDDIVAAIYGLDPDDVPDFLKLQEGGYSRGNSGCLVGSTFAKDNNVKVGSRIAIGTDGSKGTLRVTGIIEERGMAFDVSTDSAIVVTKDWFDTTYNRNDYDKVVVKVKNLDEIASVKAAIEKQMNRRDTTVDVMDTRKTMETIFQAFGQITTFVSAIGGISMLVAGVSILNIMMMSVTERIKEIGIMRSIGAQRKEVMAMFLYEAAILGVIGSIIGGLLSLLGGYAISSLMLQTTKYLFVPSSLIHIAYGMTFGIIICLICGIYPAWRAANLNPIDALRHE